jgi:hypothetical protein
MESPCVIVDDNSDNSVMAVKLLKLIPLVAGYHFPHGMLSLCT